MVNKIKQVKKLASWVAFLAIVVVLLNACHKTGTLTQQDISITGEIKGVIIEGPWEVVIEQNNVNNSATVEYNVPKDKITAKLLSNGYLHIKVSSIGDYRNVILRANIAASFLENIEGSGATNIYVHGQFSNSTDISLSGASKLDGFLCVGESANVNLSGASKLKKCTFKGNRLDVVLSGASDADYRNVEVNRCKVNASGASHFNGDGYAVETSFTGSGASSFKTFDLESENLTIDLSGASIAEVSVNNTIKGRLSGASTLKYRNATNVQVDVEGASKITQVY
jgi:hypothetical protein